MGNKNFINIGEIITWIIIIIIAWFIFNGGLYDIKDFFDEKFKNKLVNLETTNLRDVNAEMSCSKLKQTFERFGVESMSFSKFTKSVCYDVCSAKGYSDSLLDSTYCKGDELICRCT